MENKMKDPVCGMEVPADSQFRAGYKGQTYYFCNEEDKKEFQDRPEVYVRKVSAEASGGKP